MRVFSALSLKTNVLLVGTLVLSAQRATAQNLIPDPTFSSSVSAWTTRGALAPFTKLEWIAAPGADGALGFARMTALTGGPGGFFARVCLPVQPGTTYSWGGSFRFPSSQNRVASFAVYFYPDSACANPTFLATAMSPVVGGLTADPGTWYAVSGPDIAPPPTSASVSFEAQMAVISTTSVSVDFDNVYFGPQGTRAPVVASVPALSRPALIALAATLAAAAISILARR